MKNYQQVFNGKNVFLEAIDPNKTKRSNDTEGEKIRTIVQFLP